MNVFRGGIYNDKIINKQQVKIFGKTISVKVKYQKIKNPELDLEGDIIYLYLPNKYKKGGNVGIFNIAIEKMYDEIARIEIEKVMEETRIMLKGLAPENYEIRRISNKLAKTLQNKTIVINPEIIKYDKKILRYVILHEFCHLKYKTHSKGFFDMMESYMNDYENYDYILDVA